MLHANKEIQVHVLSYGDEAARRAGTVPATLYAPLRLSLAKWGGEPPGRSELYPILAAHFHALNSGQVA